MCTLWNFTSTIEQCIKWARDNLDGYFVNNINEIRLFIEDRNIFYNEISNKLVKIYYFIFIFRFI